MKIMKQTVVARSTGHSEMIALALLAQKIQACRDILAELGYLTGSTRVLEDNQAVCLQAGGDHQAAKSAHYRRDQASVDEAVNAARIYVDKVPSKLNCSDLGTKAVAPVELFEFLRDRMTGYDLYGVQVHSGSCVRLVPWFWRKKPRRQRPCSHRVGALE